MSDLKTLHRQAMDLAETAAMARLRGEREQAADLFRQAFEYERSAANLVESDFSAEPTRSILYRSAASLALDNGDVREAERLIATALTGEPPSDIAEELRDLLEQVYFQRHLELRGWALDTDEVQLSIAGKAVGFGIASSDELIDRVQNFEKLIYRTVERKSGAKYREKGHPKKAIRKDYEVFMSVPRAASFAVSLKVGLTQPQMSFDLGILNELLDCLELFNEANEEALRRQIPEEPYYRNFVGLARRMSPDGNDVNLVGFTTFRNGEERKVALTRERAQHFLVEQAVTTDPASETVTVRGSLRFADSTKGQTGRIRLIEAQGKTHDIIVPEGMMSDIVRPLYEYDVVVKGIRVGRAIHLEDIFPSDE